MSRDTTLTVWDNAKHLTVAKCREHLMLIDAQIVKLGPLMRLIENREFFERHLARCMKKREGRYDHEQ
jgi:hypothetical protein